MYLVSQVRKGGSWRKYCRANIVPGRLDEEKTIIRVDKLKVGTEGR